MLKRIVNIGMVAAVLLFLSSAIVGQERYGDPMHGAVLADFSWCLHVRKRKYSSPSDLGNRPKKQTHSIRTELEQRQSTRLKNRARGAQQDTPAKTSLVTAF